VFRKISENKQKLFIDINFENFENFEDFEDFEDLLSHNNTN
jgi:hypothetical protein